MELTNLLKHTALLFLMSIQMTFAAKYYVNAVKGNDNNTGLSPKSAWQTINKVNTFKYASGDVIAFNRGQTFTGYTLMPNANNLTFAAYGSGNLPVIDAQNNLQYCVKLNHKIRITFSYLKFYNGAVECMDVNNANYLTLDSCIFDGNFHEAQTVYIGLSYYTHITRCTFKNAASGGIYKHPHGLYLGGGGYQIVEYCKFLNNQSCGIHINVNVNPDGRVLHPIIRYNWFEGNSQNFQDQASDSLDFYNNIIVDNPNIEFSNGVTFSYEGAYSQYAPKNALVHNNLIITNDSLHGHIGIFVYGAKAINGLTFKNNILLFMNARPGKGNFIYQQAGSGAIKFDNNLFYRNGGNKNNFANLQGVLYKSFNEWKASGQNPNCVWTNPIYNYPKYMNSEFLKVLRSINKLSN